MKDSVRDRVQAHFGELAIEARRMGRRLGPHLRHSVSHEELVSWGSFGLLEAARRYDPERGIPFELRQHHELEGRLAMAAGDAAAAVPHLEQANQQDPRVLLLLAEAHREQGMLEEARDYASRAADYNGLGINYAYARLAARKLAAELS